MFNFLNSNLLNDYTKPILFVFVAMTGIVLFTNLLQGLGLLFGLMLSFVTFYYFGKVHDGWLFITSVFLVSLAWDLIQPPYAIDVNGVINSSIFFNVSSIDYTIGIFFSGIGYTGIILFYMTYVIGFAILFSMALFLGKLSQKDKKRRSIN